MEAGGTRPYHHGNLREVVLLGALEEIEAVGTARMSLREIARRAGVSHAAPAHHFGDKAGIFTAIAAQGYELLAEETRGAPSGSGSLLRCGIAYVRFALTHRAHFEVMFRPDLCHRDDPVLVAKRDASFEVLRRAVEEGHGPQASEQDVLATSVAAWSAVHGFATLWLYGNLLPKLGEAGPLEALVADMAQAFVSLGEITRRQMGGIVSTGGDGG